MSQYRLIFTNIGLSKKQNAELNNDYIQITKFAVGSGNIVNLLPTMTGLIHEEYRADINNVDTKNGTTVFDLIVPSSVGGFYIKEVALFDVDGDCICIGNVPITYKVNQDEGASKAIHLKVSTTSTNTENIVFNTDDSLVYATVSYVNNSVNTLRNEMLLELPKKVNVLDVKNGLTFTDIDKPLSALQGKVLKQLIDNINTLLLSDNTALDNLQEIVDFIELHQITLNTLGIGNIAGLQNALNAKLGINSNAVSATKLLTVRLLGGVPFDGTANINLPGVNVKGNQDTSGTAENANKLLGKNWNWSGQAGQTNWFFGTDGGTDFNLYNPANFNVNYANTAGSANSITYVAAAYGAAQLPTGEIGTYALMSSPGIALSAGQNVAGSSLQYSTAYGSWAGSATGTWKCMGRSLGNNNVGSITLFLRIA